MSIHPDPRLRSTFEVRFHAGLYLAFQGARGRPVRRWLRRLEAAEPLPPDELARRREADLHARLDHARRRVPLYRTGRWERALRARDHRELEAWPILEREHVAGDARRLMTRPPRPWDAVRRSSATTGDPVRVWIDRRSAAWGWAWEYHVMKRMGVPVGTPTLVLWGGAVRPAQDWVKNRRTFSTTGLTTERLDAAVEFLVGRRPPVIWSYPSAALQLARRVAELHGEDAPVVSFIKVGGEPLFPFQRQEIERVFRGRVVNFFGASEVGPVATECPSGSMHVVAENVHAEILEGDVPAPPGELGDLVLTALTNPLMPLIRYRIGDLARFGTEPCPCGWPRPVLAEVKARDRDVFESATGGERHATILTERLEPLLRHAHPAALRQIAFRQVGPAEWSVVVEGTEDVPPDLARRIRDVIRRAAGPQAVVRVTRTDLIEREPSGKFRYVHRASAPGRSAVAR